MISQGVFIALGRTRIPLAMSILRIWLLRYIFILTTQKYLGLYSIFWGNLFSNTLAGLIFFILVKSIDWKKEKYYSKTYLKPNSKAMTILLKP